MKHAMLAGWLLSCAGTALAASADCATAEPVALRVQVGSAPADALLEGGATPQLQIRDAATGVILWSAGNAAAASQPLFDASVRFAGSLAAVDTDADGLHDRLYVGDDRGRIWRLDLHNGAPAPAFADVLLFADLGDASGRRGFTAPADLSLAQDGAHRWLVVAIGTSGSPDSNRFYLLRDELAVPEHEPAPPARAIPILESHLVPFGQPPGAGNEGFYIGIGAQDVRIPAITVDGRVTLATAQLPAAGACVGHVSTTSLDLTSPGTGELQWRHLGPMPIRTRFEINVDADTRQMRCSLGGTSLTSCSAPVPVLQRFWRRGDAD